MARPATPGRWVPRPPAEHGALYAVALLPAQRGLGAGALHHLRGRVVLLRVRGGALRVYSFRKWRKRKGRCLPCGFPSVLCYVCMVLLDDNFHISRFPLQRVLLVQFREGTLREGVQPGKTTGDSEKSGEGLACLHHVGDTDHQIL